MLQRIVIGTMIGVLALATSPASADPTFHLSSPTDLSTLTVGQKVEIDVTLSGLPSNDFIFNLDTKILFPSAMFTPIPDPTSTSGLTATVTPGSVFYNFVQGPLQIANFNAQSSLNAGAAIGNFSESPNTNSGAIGLNGVYYSFLLQATSAGSGSIQFDPTPGANQYAANNTGFNFAPLVTAGGPLSFTISSVPEPSSIVLVASGVAFLGCWRLARRRPAA